MITRAFLKTFVHNYKNFYIILINGSVINVDTEKNYFYLGQEVMEMYFKGNSKLNIQVSYELIDKIIINSK